MVIALAAPATKPTSTDSAYAVLSNMFPPHPAPRQLTELPLA